jgi:mRNA interferase YafQ
LLSVITTKQFEKDYKRIKSRSKEIEKIKTVMLMLANGEPLDATCRDHKLKGNFEGHRECHIAPDWLLIYKSDPGEGVIVFVRTGSHSDLFG